MKVSGYVVLEPVYYASGHIHSVRMVRVLQRRPSRPIAGAAVVMLSLDVDERAFAPLLASVEVSVPADLVEAVPAVVEDATEPER